MSKVETVKTVIGAIEAQEWSKATSYLTEDFIFGGAAAQPLSGEQWLGVHRAFAAAFSNFSFNLQDVREEGGKVLGKVHLTGNHTGELRLPVPGIPAVPPTGRHISLPTEPVIISFRDEKLSNFEVESGADGGLPGILKQVGVTPAAH